jgi:hypothetical protein
MVTSTLQVVQNRAVGHITVVELELDSWYTRSVKDCLSYAKATDITGSYTLCGGEGGGGLLRTMRTTHHSGLQNLPMMLKKC